MEPSIDKLLNLKFTGSSYDSDAVTFFTAAGITDTTQKSAWNTLVLAMKGYGVWTKMLAVYPMLGGTAGSHSVNAKNPGTYNIILAGGWTHSSTGAKPNGSTAYGRCIVKASDTGDKDSLCFGTYLGTQSIEATACPLGSYDLTTLQYFTPTEASTLTANCNDLIGVSGANNESNKFFIVNRGAANLLEVDKHGSLFTSNATVSIASGTLEFYIGALNLNGVAGYFSTFEDRFAFVASKLTPTERTNFFTAVQTYQTTLSRNT